MSNTKEERPVANPVKRLSEDSGSILTTASQKPPAPSTLDKTPIVADSYITVVGKLDDIIPLAIAATIPLAEAATTKDNRANAILPGILAPSVEVKPNRAKPVLYWANQLWDAETTWRLHPEKARGVYLAEDVERIRAEHEEMVIEYQDAIELERAENKTLRESLASEYAHHRCPDCPGRGSACEIVGGD